MLKDPVFSGLKIPHIQGAHVPYITSPISPAQSPPRQVDLTITPDFSWDEKGPGVEGWWVIVEDQDCEIILHSEFLVIKRAQADQDTVLAFTVPISEPLPPQYFVKVVSDAWLGCESVTPLNFRNLILPERFPPPSELLDL